jgi:hypothetical protein
MASRCAGSQTIAISSPRRGGGDTWVVDGKCGSLHDIRELNKSEEVTGLCRSAEIWPRGVVQLGDLPNGHEGVCCMTEGEFANNDI